MRFDPHKPVAYYIVPEATCDGITFTVRAVYSRARRAKLTSIKDIATDLPTRAAACKVVREYGAISVQPIYKKGRFHCDKCGTQFFDGSEAFAPGPAKRTRKQWRDAIRATAPKGAKKKPRHDLAEQVRVLGADSLLPPGKR